MNNYSNYCCYFGSTGTLTNLVLQSCYSNAFTVPTDQLINHILYSKVLQPNKNHPHTISHICGSSVQCQFKILYLSLKDQCDASKFANRSTQTIYTHKNNIKI